MLRHAVQRLWVLLAFALTVCLPLPAAAAILQVCEDDPISVVPIEVDAGVAGQCDRMAAADETTGDAGAAPLCDPRGASVIAPPRIHPIADARIDIAAGCGEKGRAPSVGPSQRDRAPADDAGGAVSYALPVPELELPPAPAEEMLSMPAMQGGPRVGFRPGVYHPPR
jgi:hypothetical protein